MSLHPRQIATFLLETEPVFGVLLNPKVSGVVLPRHLHALDQVKLDIGRGLARPPLDLVFDDYGFTATLSFNFAPFPVTVPWHAILGIEDQHGAVVAWTKPVEAAKAPPVLLGRQAEGEVLWWCPRRQALIDDCDKFGCIGSECHHASGRFSDHRLRMIRGGKTEESTGNGGAA